MHLSEVPEQEKLQLLILSTGSMIFRMVKSDMMELTSTILRKNDLRRSLGIVLQDTNLFTGTIMDNIRYGRLEASDEECIAAARLANADGFIKRLPDGYNTVLHGGGANLKSRDRDSFLQLQEQR